VPETRGGARASEARISKASEALAVGSREIPAKQEFCDLASGSVKFYFRAILYYCIIILFPSDKILIVPFLSVLNICISNFSSLCKVSGAGCPYEFLPTSITAISGLMAARKFSDVEYFEP